MDIAWSAKALLDRNAVLRAEDALIDTFPAG